MTLVLVKAGNELEIVRQSGSVRVRTGGPGLRGLAGAEGQPGADGNTNGGRAMLTANRTYHVETTGSDTNDGLTIGTAFLTLQGAYNAINSSIDTAGYTVTIQVGAGTFAGISVTSPWVGGGALIFVGDETTPSNVTIISVLQVSATLPARLSFRGFKSTAGASLTHQGYGVVGFRNIEFAGFAPLGQIQIIGMGTIIQEGDYSISNGATNFHIYMTGGGYFNAIGAAKTVTLIGNPSFGAFIVAGMTCVAQYRSTTFSGSMTGKRYSASTNGVIDTGGGGASYFPGDTAGTTATGGQYT